MLAAHMLFIKVNKTELLKQATGFMTWRGNIYHIWQT